MSQFTEEEEAAIARHLIEHPAPKKSGQVRGLINDLIAEREREIFRRLGIDPDNPASMQEFNRNMIWISERRSLETTFTREGFKALITAIVLAIVTAVGFYIRGAKP